MIRLINMKKLAAKTKYTELIMLILTIAAFLIIPGKASAADEEAVYRDGIYCYNITDEANRKVKLIGIEHTEPMQEFTIPGKATIGGEEYTVAEVYVDWSYYSKEEYRPFYESVTKLNVDETFTGILYNPLYAFNNITAIEFYGTAAPEKVTVDLQNSRECLDILFIVPEGTRELYTHIIEEGINYSISSDLYEMTIEMTPTIVTSKADMDTVEYGCFAVDGLIYQVTKSAKGGEGEVQLVGITREISHSYLPLPSEVTNHGFTYKLTRLGLFSLIDCGATVVVVPDTVTEMSSGVFDCKVELLFLSKNCKVIPSRLITEENYDSNLRFVYVPEGVTTLSDNAFNFDNRNESSVILPTTISTLGKKAVYGCKLVTFLNKKPITNIASAIKDGTTVKVNSKVISKYKALLNSKVSVVAAKDIVKSTTVMVDYEDFIITPYYTKTLKGSLTKGSNENVYWLSSDTDVFEISSKGVVNPKKAGTAYAIAYTRTSGLHTAIQVTVKDKLITQDIYTYRITNASKKTVSLCQIKPKDATEKIVIPETITYSKKTYTVTGVIADPDDPSKPLINDRYDDNNITEITFPKTIAGTVGYLGKMDNIRKITFKGTSAPDAIRDWYQDGGTLAFQAVIYVPKGCVDAYSSSLWALYSNDSYFAKYYGSIYMDYNILEAGSDELSRFVADGILYRVTKKAGTASGTVAVRGADVTLKEIKVGGTVKCGKYTYKVTTVEDSAFRYANAERIILEDTITKVSYNVFNEKVKYIEWSKNCKTIPWAAFTRSIEMEAQPGQEDLYALETFIIPEGVTKLEANMFAKGFTRLKSITVPKSLTNIGKNAFAGIEEVIYAE